jgi:hypothetical protein
MASGLGPFSGQAVHFQRAAPEKTAVRGQPLPTRGRTPLCCPRQAPRGPRVHCRRRVYDRRYFGLGLDHGRHWRRSRMAGWRAFLEIMRRHPFDSGHPFRARPAPHRGPEAG